MLTSDQIDVLRDLSGQVVDPIVDFLIADIARRVSEAGQLTSTASYQVWRAKNLGVSQEQLKKEIQKRLEVSEETVEDLLTQAAETGYDFDISRFPTADVIPFSENTGLQQILKATVQMARQGLVNITQTMGFVTPYGGCEELTRAYEKTCDFAFTKVVTGAQDYTSAIRDATRHLAEKGIRTIDYASGRHTSVEAAVRRNIMGGLGIMENQISQQNHDDLGCDGWEISAHGASAPDHEPIQGKQYSDAAFTRLNGSLVRQIGTLNCGHAAMPIILGVNEPQYTRKELEAFREENEKGVTVDGKHYTLYEATQRQRSLERSIRKRKRHILIDESTGDKEKLQWDQIRLVRTQQEYRRFSKAAGLREQWERTEKAGFTWKHGKAAEKTVANRKKAAIMKKGRGALQQISSPIERRDSSKGKPGAIIHFGRPLNLRQQHILDMLPEYDRRILVKKSSVSMKDLSALTAITGDEFAMFTRKGKRLIIRGNSKSVNIGVTEAKALAREGYVWSGHTHPGVDLNVLGASAGDIQVLRCFPQSQSAIYNSLGEFLVFGKE